MARTVLTAQPKPNLASPSLMSFTSINDNGDGYTVKSEGTLLLVFWNNGVTGSATVTVSSVAVSSWYERTGDVTQAVATGAMYAVLVPSVGFSDNGYINFSVSGTGADDVDVAIYKNM